MAPGYVTAGRPAQLSQLLCEKNTALQPILRYPEKAADELGVQSLSVQDASTVASHLGRPSPVVLILEHGRLP